MKNLIIVGGTAGVGKTTTCRELQEMLPRNVFLDGDWCWDMRPFVVTDETKKLVEGNITHLLNSFLDCSEFENVIFCWVLHEQKILDDLAGWQARVLEVAEDCDPGLRKLRKCANATLSCHPPPPSDTAKVTRLAAAWFTDKRRTYDQGPTAATGDQDFDLLLPL